MSGSKGLIDMKCKICGGTLKLVDGFYLCENCHNKFEITSVYENTEVTICYVEFDDAGRRTKDSVVAQEVYTKLRSVNVDVFYHRISAGNLSAREAQKAYDYAKSNAKILILLAGSRENFSKLISENEGLLQDKKIIPVYFDINAYDLPKELAIYQALNFDNIGAIQDLSKNVLKTLGRDKEVDLVEARAKVLSKKKKVVLFTSVSVVAVFLITAVIIVFGTPYVLPGKKYDKAEELMAEEKYADAINMLSSLDDYKNSKNLLFNLYAQYVGYYHNDESNTGLHIDMTDTSHAVITITKVTPENEIVKIIESASITDGAVNFEYIDSQNNQGSAVVKFKNDGIELTLISDGESSIFFALSEKSDQPVLKSIDKKTLLNWLESKTNMSQIEALGYELIFENALYKDTGSSRYGIKNTDIKAALFDFDISKSDAYSYYADENTAVESRIAFGYSAPAKILASDRIGKNTFAYLEDDILYVPNAELSQTYMVLDFVTEEEGADTITDNMSVCCVAKAALSDNHWNLLLEQYLYGPRVEKEALKTYGDAVDTVFGVRAEGENDTHYLFSVSKRQGDSSGLYRINKKSYEIEFIDEAYYDTNNYSVIWQMDPKVQNEFPVDFDLRC